MSIIKWTVVVVVFGWVVAGGKVSAQAVDPVVGTWELNVAKSTFVPGPSPRSETRTYEGAGSEFKVVVKGIDSNGRPVAMQASYSTDGREHPIVGSQDADAQALRQIDAFTIEGTIKKGGKVVQTVRREISKDGRTMTLWFKGVNARGETVQNVMVFERK